MESYRLSDIDHTWPTVIACYNLECQLCKLDVQYQDNYDNDFICIAPFMQEMQLKLL